MGAASANGSDAGTGVGTVETEKEAMRNWGKYLSTGSKKKV